jgi:hypothetical protein
MLMADQDDELFENYDEPADAGHTDEDAKIAAFQKKVRGYQKIVLNPKQYSVEKRREAVQMLGELGEIESIPALVKVYHKDKSPGMKEAAAHALGMFKALEDALFDNDMPERQEYAQTLIENIVLHDALGQRSRMRRRPMLLVMAFLFILFIILAGVAAMTAAPKAERAAAIAQAAAETETRVAANLPTDIPGTTSTPIPTPSDMPGVVALLQLDYAALSSDTALMRAEMLKSTRQQSIDCTLTLKKSVPIVVPVTLTDPALTSVATALTKAHTDLAPVVTAYENACRTKQPITPADANTFDGTLVAIQTALFQVPGQLSTFGITPDAPVIVPTVGATLTPSNTPTPTATPDPKKFAKHITGLRQIANSMTSSNGPNTLLMQYWDDIKQSGSTGGCRNLPAPILPEDYVLPPEVSVDAPAELLTALDNVNTGLTLSRQSWRAFEQFCSDRSLSAIAATQYTAADTAQKAFKTVPDLLATAEAKLKGVGQ